LSSKGAQYCISDVPPRCYVFLSARCRQRNKRESILITDHVQCVLTPDITLRSAVVVVVVPDHDPT
jgi:hypothetical protein